MGGGGIQREIELRARRIRVRAARHAQRPTKVISRDLAGNCVARAPLAGAVGVAALRHKVRHQPVEDRAVVEAVLDQGDEVRHAGRCVVFEQRDFEAALVRLELHARQVVGLVGVAFKLGGPAFLQVAIDAEIALDALGDGVNRHALLQDLQVSDGVAEVAATAAGQRRQQDVAAVLAQIGQLCLSDGLDQRPGAFTFRAALVVDADTDQRGRARDPDAETLQLFPLALQDLKHAVEAEVGFAKQAAEGKQPIAGQAAGSRAVFEKAVEYAFGV